MKPHQKMMEQSRKNKSQQPIRTCLSCGMKKSQSELTRFTWKEDKPIEDGLTKGEGRGAYCCNGKHCRGTFLENEKKWKRAFRL